MTMDEVWKRLRIFVICCSFSWKQGRQKKWAKRRGFGEKVLTNSKLESMLDHVGSWTKLIQVSFEATGHLCPAHLAGRSAWSQRRRPTAHFLQQHTPHLATAKEKTSAKASTTFDGFSGVGRLLSKIFGADAWKISWCYPIPSPPSDAHHLLSKSGASHLRIQHGPWMSSKLNSESWRAKWIWGDHGYYMILHIIGSRREG